MSDTLKRMIEEEGGLMTTSDLARFWNVTETRVRHMAAADDFPQPVGTVSGGRSKVWSMEDAQIYRPQS